MKNIVAIGIVVGIVLGLTQGASAAAGPSGRAGGRAVHELIRVEEATPAWPAPPEASSSGFGGCIRSQVAGPAKCNCTELPATVQICEEESIEVTLGTKGIGSISTGQKSTTCTSQLVPPSVCDYMVYNVVCCKVRHWFFFSSWECWVESSSLASRPTRWSDCPKPQV